MLNISKVKTYIVTGRKRKAFEESSENMFRIRFRCNNYEGFPLVTSGVLGTLIVGACCNQQLLFRRDYFVNNFISTDAIA